MIRATFALSRCFLAVIGLSCTALAQEGRVVDEIVVQATRIPTAAMDVPASVAVVEKDDIQLARQQLGLDESLALVPGLFMQDRFNFAQDLRIAIRGFGARSNFGIRGVKIIVDGIPETLPDGQGQVDAIDLGSVERIEVIRGPSSSLYGNASGGVINIASETGPDTAFAQLRLSFGEDDFWKHQLKFGGEVGRVNYMVNVNRMAYDGYREHSETRSTQLNTRLGVELSERQSLVVALNVTDQPLANDPGGITAAQAEAAPRSARERNVAFDAGEALEQGKLGFVYSWSPDARHEVRLRNYYVWRDFANRLPFTDGGAVAIDRLFAGVGVSWAYVGKLAGIPLKTLVGLDVDRQDDERQRFANESGTRGALGFDQNERVTSRGLFAQAELAVHENVALTTGLRYDQVTFDVSDRFLSDGDDSGRRRLSELSPMVGLKVALRKTVNAFANVSTAFETPTTTELANPDGSGGFNAGLEPQFATNYELGLRGSWGRRNSFDLSVFRIDVDDELIPFEIAGQPGRDFFANAGTSRREGIELALVSRPLDGLRLSLAQTWSEFRFERFATGDDGDLSGNALPGIPDRYLQAEVKYGHASGWYGVLDVASVGDLYVNNANTVRSEAYVLSNFRAGVAVDAGNWSLMPFIGVNNLFDERYFGNVRINAFGARYFEPAPGRTVHGGITLRYNFAP